MDVEKWFSENTFHNSDFSDVERLLEKKAERGIKISVAFPALNEEETIGKEVIIIKSELAERYPLVDEVAVIDSGSRDRTREVASRFGADVYLSAEILPETGSHVGKGENLWKALYILEGDIIVYIDADIKNIHPKFIYGLVGPLLESPQIGYAKAFYQRPIWTGEKVQPAGGGRVTEILVRPLFNMFFPTLSGIVQPLSGEYAGRRDVLEKVPFSVGYGVETGLLIDISEKFGLGAIAQVDLDRRVHRNQSLDALGKMSFGILQTFLSRAQAQGKMELMDGLPYTLQQMAGDHQKGRVFRTFEIREFERPPMVEVEAYRKKRGMG